MFYETPNDIKKNYQFLVRPSGEPLLAIDCADRTARESNSRPPTPIACELTGRFVILIHFKTKY